MENEVKEVKAKKTPKELTLFILKIVGNVIFYAIIIGLLMFSIMNIRAGQGYVKGEGEGFPNLFGKGYLTVQNTGSMEKNGDLAQIDFNGEKYSYDDFAIQQFGYNDLLNVDVFKESDWNEIKIGDVLAFYDSQLQALNTHRVVYMTFNADGTIFSISLEGDRIASENCIYDPVHNPSGSNAILQHVSVISYDHWSSVKGKVTSVNYGGGSFMHFVQSNWLFIFVLPVGLFLIFEVFMVIKNIMDLRGAKNKAELAADKEAMAAELEAQREEMRKQILAELAANQNNNEKVEEEKDPFEAYSEKEKEE